MSVYVDNGRHPYRGMQMSHMLADTVDELHAMADIIGVARLWFQSSASTPHYDVCRAKRQLAIRHGAIAVDRRDLVVIIRRLRGVMALHDVVQRCGKETP